MKSFEKEIKAYALKNAIEFGKAEPGKVLTKLFQHGLEKKDIKKTMPEIAKLVSEINSLSEQEKERQFLILKDIVKEHEEKERELPELKNIKNGVVTRIPPEPSKYAHLGHAITFLINYLYAKKYNGKCLLRFEDANPEKVSQEYVDAMLEDIKNYLSIEYNSVRYVSDDMTLLYEYAKKLISMNKAYICFCEREKMQELRHQGKECECRSKNIKENLSEWKNFLNGEYKEGEAVLRIKGNMKSENHVMRDNVMFRIIDKPHYRHKDKFKAWPTYDFYSGIEEHLMGITHILRSNEFDLRVELQEHIKKLLGLKSQEIVQYGRFNVIGAETKGREIRELIASGDYEGWDDPRLVTLRALKRRGIRKEVIYELVNHVGFAKKQVNIDFDMIASISRKLLDEKTSRYYFVASPKALEIAKMPEIKEVEVKLHPNKNETRKIKIEKTIYISGEDYGLFKGKEVRLMNLCNIMLGVKPICTGIENKKIQKIQWVSEFVKARIKMPNNEWISGLAEKAVENLKIDDLIQFERFGFCRLDANKNGIYEFWFAHK